MKELKLTWSQDICIVDGYIGKICEYLKTHNDETLSQMFPHLYRHKQVIAPLIPMMRFYPTSHGHVLKPLGEFVDHIIDQIEHYIEMMDKIPLPYMIPVSLPKIRTHGDEMLILVNNRSNNVISKLLDYYDSLKQGDDKMIALVYTKIPNLGIVISEILPYEVKCYKDDDSWTNVSIEFIDVFTNKKCTFEFKGDEIMGVNIKDNTSEGAAFEQALAFANKEKHKSVVRPKKVDEKLDNHECVVKTRNCLLYYERLNNIVNCCVFDCNLCKDTTFKTTDELLFVWLCSILNTIVITKNTDVNLELIKNACERLHSNGNLTDVYDEIVRCIKAIELCG